MKIEEVLNENSIHLDKDLTSKKEVFDYLCSSLYQNGMISDKNTFQEKVYDREALSVTGLIDGVAIPHGVSDAVNQPSVAFVRTKKEIEWESIDGKKIKYIFLLAIPNNTKDDVHIKMLSELARSLMDQNVISKLEYVETADELLNLLKKGGSQS